MCELHRNMLQMKQNTSMHFMEEGLVLFHETGSSYTCICMWAYWLGCKLNFIGWVTDKIVWKSLGLEGGTARVRKACSPPHKLSLPVSCWFIIPDQSHITLPATYCLPCLNPHLRALTYSFSSHCIATIKLFAMRVYVRSPRTRKKQLNPSLTGIPRSSDSIGVRDTDTPGFSSTLEPWLQLSRLQ